MSRKNTRDRSYSDKGNGSVERMEKIKRKHRGHKVITLITFTVLLIYLLGYLVAFLNKPSIGIEIVDYGTLDVPVEFNGVIVRDETVFTSNMEGQPAFSYTDGERVKKGSTICTIKNVSTTNLIEDEIKKIDKNILKAQKARSDISVFQDDINRIEKSITSSVDAAMPKLLNGSVSEIYTLRNQIETQIDMRNEIWLTESKESLSALAEEREQYQTQLDGNTEAISTDRSGIVSLRTDGYEDVFTPDTLDQITKEQTNMNITSEYISKSKPVAVGEPVFKIIDSNNWNIVAYINSTVCQNWEVGDAIELISTIDDDDKDVRVIIDKMEVGDKETRVEFSTDKAILDFLDYRNLTFRIRNDLQKGLKIPNNAIVEKTLLKIPSECIMEAVDKNVVIKRADGLDTPMQIEIKNKVTREYGVSFDIYVIQNADSLKLGDVILKGTGETAVPYTISEVDSFKGVYIVNSSVAKFNIITILAQNSDYALAKADTTLGIRVHDNIVSDAKNVEDNDPIF